MLCPLLLLLYLQSAHARRARPRTTREPSLPAELRDGDLAAWKIPNEIFCRDMERNLDGRVLILPWWHHYCQDLKDSKAKQPPSNYYYLPIHRAVLDDVQWYRRNNPQLGGLQPRGWLNKMRRILNKI